MAHEFGHVIYKGAFIHLNQAEAKGILNQFEKWRTNHGKGNDFIEQLIRSKKTPAATAEYLAAALGDRRVGEVSDTEAEYLLDFEEWFADEVSKVLTNESALVGPVRRFFQRIVQALKQLFRVQKSYDSVEHFVRSVSQRSGLSARPISPDGLVSHINFLNEAYQVSAAMSPAVEKLVQKAAGVINVEDFMVKKLEIDTFNHWDNNFNPTAAEIWSWFSKLHHSASDHVALTALTQYAFQALTDGHREVLARAARTPAMQAQLRRELGNDDITRKRIQEPAIAAAEMYGLWLQGRIKIGPKTEAVYRRLLKKARGVWGVLQDEQAGIQVMKALDEAVPKLREMTYIDSKTAGIPNPLYLKGLKQQLGPQMTKVLDVGRRTFLDAAETMRSFQVSAADWITDRFSNKTGQDYRGETLPDAKIRMISRLRNEFIKTFKDRDADFGHTLLGVLHNRKLLSASSPDIKQAYQAIQRTFKKTREYLLNAGLEVKEVQDYFPWVFETDYLADNNAEFYELLMQDKFALPLHKLGGVFAWKAIQGRIQTLEYLRDSKSPQFTGSAELELSQLTDFVEDWRTQLPKKEWTPEQKAGSATENAWATMFLEAAKNKTISPLLKGMTDQHGVVDKVYNNIMRNSMDDELQLDKPTYVPAFRSANVRVLNFVRHIGDTSDMDRLAKFFHQDIGHTLDTYINTSVKKAEYARRFGTKGEILVEKFTQAVDEYDRRMREQHPDWSDNKREAHVTDFRDTMDNYIHAMLGTHGVDTWIWLHKTLGWTGMIPDPNAPENKGRPIHPRVQKIINTIMVYQNIRLLVLATISSLVDPIGIAVRTGDLGLAFNSFRSGIKSVFMESIGEHDLQVSLGKMLGIIDTNLTNEALGWEYGGVYMTGWQRNLNEGFFKWTGLQWWTRSTRVMALHAGMRFLAYHKNLPKKTSKRWLDELGVSPDDIVLDENGEITFHTVKDRETASEEEKQRDDRIKHALFRFVDESILRPTASYRPIWASDQHYALFFHLKSFMYTFHDRYVRRMLHELDDGNYMPVLALSMFVPAMMAAEMLRDLIQHGGEPPRKAAWGLPEYLMNGLTRSGVPGITLVGFDAANDIEYGGIGLESWAGPTVQQLFNFDPVKALPVQNLWRGYLPEG